MAQSAKSSKPANVVSLVQPTTGEAAMTADQLNALIAQQRQLNAAIKAAKAAMPKPSPLDRVIAKQSHQFSKWMAPNLASRVQERMRVGQSQEDAMREVVAFFVAQTEVLLATADDADATSAN